MKEGQEWATRIGSVPEPYTARFASRDDIPAATEFFNRVEISEHGEPDWDEDDVSEEWASLDPGRDVLLVETADARIVGSMTVEPRGNGTFNAAGYVHPEHASRGIGSYLVAFSERRASAEPEAPGSSRIRVHNWVSGVNGAANTLLRERRYQHVRTFYRMERTMTERPADPSTPAGIRLRSLREDDDLESVFRVYDQAFADHWSNRERTFEFWKRSVMENAFDPALWTLAFRGEELVGISVGRTFGEEGWISSIGVLDNERGLGIGRAILERQFAAYWEKGISRVALGVDAENTTGALRLYQRSTMSLTRQYNLWERWLT
jgi:mycothiol synthase